MVIIEYLKFEAYLEALPPIWVVDGLRTLKVHHSLSLVTIGLGEDLLCFVIER